MNYNCIPFFIVVVGMILLPTSHIASSSRRENNAQSVILPSAEENRIHSEQAFATVLSVIKHPRCMNCHPTDDAPRQAEDRHIHRSFVQRGADGHGMATMRCNTCHQSENNQISNVPGAPHWHLAPKSMGWQGLSDAEIGKTLLDKSKNGNRSFEDLVKHLTEDPLVRWAWTPGKGRSTPPVPFEEFSKAVKEWAATGAAAPSK